MRWRIAVLFALIVLSSGRAAAQTDIRIAAPSSGSTLSGLVNVMGTSAAEGFASSELSFAYASDPTSTWFLVYQTDSPVTDGLLAAWDTNSVTDGDYNLRLRVALQDGSILESLVTGLRVRNQLPTETPAPTSAPEPTATTEFVPPPTPLPPTPQPAPQSDHAGRIANLRFSRSRHPRHSAGLYRGRRPPPLAEVKWTRNTER